MKIGLRMKQKPVYDVKYLIAEFDPVIGRIPMSRILKQVNWNRNRRNLKRQEFPARWISTMWPKNLIFVTNTPKVLSIGKLIWRRAESSTGMDWPQTYITNLVTVAFTPSSTWIITSYSNRNHMYQAY